MAITVEVGQCLDDNRVVNKTVTWTSITGSISFRDIAELHNPVFTITGVSESSEFNYCRIRGIDGLDRYYFAEVVNVRTGVAQVICRMDVLMTYKQWLKNILVIPERSESNQNHYIIDSARMFETTVQHYNIMFNGANLDYTKMSLIAGIVGTSQPLNL